MHPELLRVLGEPIPSYSAMLVVGYAVATFLLARWAKRNGLDHEVIIDLGLITLVFGVIGLIANIAAIVVLASRRGDNFNMRATGGKGLKDALRRTLTCSAQMITDALAASGSSARLTASAKASMSSAQS